MWPRADIHQLNLIFQLLGTPSEDDLGWVSNEKALQYVLSLPKQPAVPLDRLFAKKAVKPNPLALDLIRRMLTFNPHKRISVEEALNHPYLKPLNVKDDTPLPPAFDFNFEKQATTKAGIQGLMLEEVGHFRPDWYRAQLFPDQYEVEIEDEKPDAAAQQSLDASAKKH
jgi:mitogen-activated protein kinase 1/3